MNTGQMVSGFVYEDGAGEDRNTAIVPKGIDDGAALETASAAVLLEQHLKIEREDAKAFWRDGFILFRIWTTGEFCGMLAAERATAYPYSKDGFYSWLHDHGSHISAAEASRRMAVFRAFNKFDVTIIRLVEKAGINKAYMAVPHIHPETVKEMLELCIGTPHHRLKNGLNTLYARPDAGKIRNAKSKDQIRRDDQQRAALAISEESSGMIGSPAIFVPRQYRQETVDEIRARETFTMAMARANVKDRDAFFMRVVCLVGEKWLTSADRRAIDQIVEAHLSGEAARRAAE